MNSIIDEGNKFITHSQNFNNKFACKYWLDIRPETSYFKVGDIYNNSVEGRFIKMGKLVNIIPKFIDSLFERDTLLAFGMNIVDAEEYIRKRYNSSSTQRKINYKKQRLLIMTFEEYNEKVIYKQLTLT